MQETRLMQYKNKLWKRYSMQETIKKEKVFYELY